MELMVNTILTKKTNKQNTFQCRIKPGTDIYTKSGPRFVLLIKVVEQVNISLLTALSLSLT